MSRFTFNFYLDIRKPLKSGLYSIKVNCYDGAEKRGINFTIKKVDGIEISSSKSDWIDIWENRFKRNNFGEVTGETVVYGHKATIRTILKAKEDILNELTVTEGIRSLEAIKRSFNDYVIPTKFTDNVYEEFARKISELQHKEKYKTASSYNTTLNNISKHNNHFDHKEQLPILNKDFRFSDLTKFWLSEYERVRTSKGISKGSIGIDTRYLRHLYNRVKKNDSYLMENYPFGSDSDKYTSKTAKAKNQGLRKEDIAKLIKFSSDNYYLQRARDIFLFSYFFGGMNYKDLILLTPKDIDNGYFIRKKTVDTTNEVVKIPININEIQREIVERYKGTGKYLFNFLKDNATAYEIFKEQGNGIKKNWKWFKRLANELGLNEKLSYQWARHSFGTNLYLAEGVSERSIQEAMGHTSITTTRNYIDSLVNEEQDAINKALMPELDEIPEQEVYINPKPPKKK